MSVSAGRQRAAGLARGLAAAVGEVAPRIARRRRSRRAGMTLFAALGQPEPEAPVVALIAVARAAGELRPCLLSAPVELDQDFGAVARIGGRTLSRRPQLAGARAVWLVDTPAALVPATEALRRAAGVALLWEPAAVLGDEHAAAIRALAASAGAVVVPARDDAARLRMRVSSRARIEVLAPPLAWSAAAPERPEQPGAAAMLGPLRILAVARRRRPLVVIARRAALGRLDAAEIGFAAALVRALAEAGVAADIALLGEADDEALADAWTRLGPLGGRLRRAPWPVRDEWAAWLTAASALLEPGCAPAARRAATERAWLAERPLVLATPDCGNAAAAELCEVLAARRGLPRADPLGPADRRPEPVASALLELLDDIAA